MTGNSFVCTLFSSSGGNCVYIKNKGEEYLIDAGASARAIENALKTLGTSLANIDAIFITHEHTDHIKGLETISKCYEIPIYAPSLCCAAIGRVYERACFCLNPLEKDGGVCFGETAFEHFRTPHDSVSSCGYVVDFGGKRAGVATDMGYITKDVAAALSSCEAVIIESNHDINMLKNGPYPLALKKRILGNYGHLSNTACAEFLPYLVSRGVKAFALAHLSAENNTPAAAYAESYNSLTAKDITVCHKTAPGDVYLTVAPREGICVVLDE